MLNDCYGKYSANTRGDRFIPRRFKEESASIAMLRKSIYNQESKNHVTFDSFIDGEEIVNTLTSNNNLNIYRETCENIENSFRFFVVLRFSAINKSEDTQGRSEEKQSWPVRPRKKPLISNKSNQSVAGRFADWTKYGHIVAVHKNVVKLCNPNNTFYKCFIVDANLEHSIIKASNEGSKIAFSYNKKKLYIGNIEASEWNINICNASCPCWFCSVTALEWTQKGELVSGCSSGRLCLWNNELRAITDTFRGCFTPIRILKFSSNQNYLAVCFDNEITFLEWPTTVYLKLRLPYVIKSLAWHPWKESLLCIGTKGGALYVYNIVTGQEIRRLFICDPGMISNLSFNKISGELVVVCEKKHSSLGKIDRLIYVLSDIDKIVDAIEWDLGGINLLLWSPDSSALALTTSSKNRQVFSLWNFFGKETENKYKYRSQICTGFRQCTIR